MNYKPAMIALSVVSVLGACSSNSTSPDDLTVAKYNTLAGRVEQASNNPIEAGDQLPSSAQMSGYIAFNTDQEQQNSLPENVVFTGNMDVTADFSRAEISGKATNFSVQALNDGCDETACTATLVERLDGELILKGGINRGPENALFEGFLDGTLSGDFDRADLDDGTETGSFSSVIDAEVDGVFGKDDNGVLMAGAAFDGTAKTTPTIGDTPGTELTSGINGVFAVSE